MFTLSIVSQKGGTGKTTLAVHLAEAFARTLRKPAVLIDLDPQASAAKWGDRRSTDNPTVVATPASRLTATLEAAAKGGAAVAVIDTAPHSESSALAAAKAADLVLIPCRYSGYDLDALDTTADLLKLAKASAYVVLNSFPARASGLIADARTAVGAKGFEVAPVVLTQRAAFRDASITGRTAAELDAKSAASAEIARLAKWIQSVLTR